MKKFRSAYSGNQRVYNPQSGEPTRTKQEFRDEVDINEIVARMRRGISPPAWMTANTPRYGDFTNVPTSFSEAYAVIERAEEAFLSLPLEFRRELDHNPANLDKAPRELFERFGLLKKSPGAEAAIAATDSGDDQRVQGEQVLPVKRPAGANKAAPKDAAKGAD